MIKNGEYMLNLAAVCFNGLLILSMLTLSLSLSLLHQRCFILLTPTFTSQQSNRFLPDLCCEVKLLSELILRREG